MTTGIIQIEVDGFDVLGAVVQKLGAFNETAAVDEASALLLNKIRTRFLSQVDPNGQPWIVSKAALIREKLGIGGGTLYDTGNLFHSLQLYSISPNERAIGTDVPYAGYLNDGTVKMPAREFMGLSDVDVSLAESVVVKRIQELLGNE
jgi:phage gpG-like protein